MSGSSVVWNILQLFLLCIIVFTASEASVSNSDAAAFATWLDGKNEFSASFPRKFSVVPTEDEDMGFLGGVKPVASEEIEENEIVYRFSPSLSFNFQKDVDGIFQEDFVDMLHLIHEKKNGKESRWAPYLNILPQTFTTPIFWTREEIDELAGTSLYSHVLRLNATITRDYNYVITNKNYSRIFPDPTNMESEENLVTAQEWRWAYSIFRSRNWKTPKGPKISPVLDIFNYGQESNVKVVAREGHVDLIAETTIAKGETLLINDGLIGNRELLEWYGFVVANNRNDYYPVGVGLDNEEKLYGMKRDYFKKRGITDGQTFHLKNNLIPQDLVFALRVYHANIYDYSELDNALENKMLTAQNEMSVCNTIIDLCEATLENLSHSLKSDKELLDSSDISGPLRSAATIRRSEKKILVSVLKLAKMQVDDVKKHWSTRTMDIPTVSQRY